MSNLMQNYKIILKELKQTCSHIKSSPQIRQPKLSYLELAALNFTVKYMSYNTELQLFRAIEGTFLECKIECSVYNRRRRKLFDYFEKIRRGISGKFSHLSNVFTLDSAPVKICEACRAKRSGICGTEEIYPDFGYRSAKKSHYFGYKLHLVCDENAVVYSFDLTPASVHEVNYLKDVNTA